MNSLAPCPFFLFTYFLNQVSNTGNIHGSAVARAVISLVLRTAVTDAVEEMEGPYLIDLRTTYTWTLVKKFSYGKKPDF